MLGKFVDIKVFIISLAIGLLMVYLYHPQPTIVYVYPTPDNINKILFKDKANNCYKFTKNEVSCSGKNTKEIPLQN